ncbi:glycosyltransferase family 4 protein [Ostreococcus tauri]|uniref:Alpha-1,3/1,6-mannosyltransferase ALG2 n=1 Tax=Ostreococcus tauri TaxID=70448 RepID=A0A1Y5I3L9_OSTTA|nr:glycosyltransferase family 4 protein [Ostreococcus tauri]
MIGVLHPDLGIGGAERLIVDVASSLERSDVTVLLYTAHHDIKHCFEETVSKGCRVEWVCIRGGWLPGHLFGCFHVLCANVRCAWAAMRMIIENKAIETAIIDQVFLPILIFRLFSRAKVVFYCHYPDKLLATRSSILRRTYRLLFDALEGLTMSLAHQVIVNSVFTSQAYKLAFRHWSSAEPIVLYPSIRMPEELVVRYLRVSQVQNRTCFLSINRFERKKRLHYAIIALKKLRQKLGSLPGHAPYLILGGGYDTRVDENVHHFSELNRRVYTSAMFDFDEVLFLPSISDELKYSVLRESIALLYTPENEHFGITPLEAMAVGRPVIACDSGGPCETIIHESTGLLVKGGAQGFADGMMYLYQNPVEADRMGNNGRQRVEKNFTLTNFSDKLNGIIN